MRKAIYRSSVSLLLLLTSVLVANGQSTSPDETERFTAVARRVGGGPRGASTGFLNITIESYTTDEELNQLATTLREQGADALQEAMREMDRGWAAPAATTAHRLNFARARQVAEGRRILLAAERPITFFELRRLTRSSDYEFGIIQLTLDQEGRGEGLLIPAAQVRFNDQGVLEVEQYGYEPIELANVRRVER